MKKRHARELSRNQPILRFDVEQCLLHTGFSLAGKRGVLFFLSFHPLAYKTNDEHLPKTFFMVIRKSLC